MAQQRISTQDDPAPIGGGRETDTALRAAPESAAVEQHSASVAAPPPLPVPDVSRMGCNPANFAYWIGEEPWVPGYAVSYAISFYDAASGIESARSAWWGPKTDPKKRYGGFGLIRIPTDPTGRATSRRIYRQFRGQPERMIDEIPDNTTTKYQDGVR